MHILILFRGYRCLDRCAPAVVDKASKPIGLIEPHFMTMSTNFSTCSSKVACEETIWSSNEREDDYLDKACLWPESDAVLAPRVRRQHYQEARYTKAKRTILGPNQTRKTVPSVWKVKLFSSIFEFHPAAQYNTRKSRSNSIPI